MEAHDIFPEEIIRMNLAALLAGIFRPDFKCNDCEHKRI